MRKIMEKSEPGEREKGEKKIKRNTFLIPVAENAFRLDDEKLLPTPLPSGSI